jgi:hypothetical protein
MSRLSVSRKIATDLPPSSRWTRFSVFAAASMIFFPVATLPVKLTLSMRGSETSVSDIAVDCPVTKFTTPGGRSASAITSARKRFTSGPHGEGLKTIVQPVASAGPSFCTATNIGKFHVGMSPQTPAGCRFTTPTFTCVPTIVWLTRGGSGTSNSNVRASSA